MKQPIKILILLLAAVALVPLAARAQGTAFTYQGRLNDGTGPANGTYHLRFALFDAQTVGNQIGSPLTNSPVNVSNGLFTVTLDFGANFPGADRWLEIGVRTNGGGAFATLGPRQPITATPYAITAGNLSGALSGTSLSGTYSSPVTLNNVANNFAGSGANLTALDATQLTSGTVPDARLSANVALRAGGNAFTGNQTITDNLGIGTVTPSQKLQIVGPENSAIDLATGPLTLRSSVNSVVGASIGTVSSHELTLFTGNLPRETITADGKVGIGKSAPATALDVNGTITGTGFQGNGAGLTNLNAATLGGLGSAAIWQLGGNAGTTPGTQFLGTTDNQPLEFKVNNHRGLRLEPTAYLDTVNVIGGSAWNFVGAGVSGATIGGGGGDSFMGYTTNRVEADFGTVSGGVNNTIQAIADYATLGGGYQNTIQTNAYTATIGGGSLNTIQSHAGYATIGGGSVNTIQNSASSSTIGGGYFNTIQTSAQYATIPGGRQNSATSYAFAAGRRAKANHPGAFVWADSTDADFASTADNQFAIRATGGVVLSGSTPSLSFGNTTRQMLNLWGTQYGIGVQGYTMYSRADVGAGFAWYQGGTHSNAAGDSGGGTELMHLTAGGLWVNTTFVSASDRNLKENFQPVDARAVLDKVAALPLTEWNYKTDAALRHIGPMAQDFYAAFNVGPDDKHIATVDADGVALAAIQGLNQKVEEKDVRIAELERRLEKLERLMNQNNGGVQ